MKYYNMRLKYGTHCKEGGEEGGGEEGGGGGTTDWRSSIPEDIRSSKVFEDIPDVGILAKAYFDTKADVGRSIRIPGPDAQADDLTAFHQRLQEAVPGLMPTPDPDNQESLNALFDKLGRPADQTGYKNPEKGIPEVIKEPIEAIKKAAHEAGLTVKQYEALSEVILKNHSDSMEMLQMNNEKEQQQLESDWGNALTAKTESIVDLLKQTEAPADLITGIENKAVGSATMKWLDSIVDALSDPGRQMNFQGQQDPGTRVTPAEANEQIEEIMAREEFWDASNPLHEGLKEKVIKLGKIAESTT